MGNQFKDKSAWTKFLTGVGMAFLGAFGGALEHYIGPIQSIVDLLSYVVK